MNLYRVVLDASLCEFVVAASERQAAGKVADELNWLQSNINYQISDFDVYQIDIDSFREPTIID